MWVVVQRKIVHVLSEDVQGRWGILHVDATVEAVARLGGEVLAYLNADNAGREVSVVYRDSATQRVCHITCGPGFDGSEDLWDPFEWGSVPGGYERRARQDAYVFPTEAAARTAVPRLETVRHTAEIRWFGQTGLPVWPSVLPNMLA